MTAPNSSTNPPPTPETPPKRRGSVSSALRQRIWLALLGTLVGGLLAGVYLYLAPRTYSSTAVIEVGTDPLLGLDLPDVPRSEPTGVGFDTRLRAVRTTLLSPAFLARIVETLALARDTRFSPSPEDGRSGAGALAARLAGLVTVEIPDKESLVKVTVAHPNAELAAQLANSLVSELVSQNDQDRQNYIKGITNKLQQSLSSTEKDLAPAREEVRRTQSLHDQAAQELSELRSRLSGVRDQRIQWEAEEQEIRKGGTNVEALIKAPSIAKDAAVSTVRAALAQKEVSFDNLKQRYKEKHPAYIDAEQELTSLRQKLAAAARAAAAGFAVQFAAAQANESDLQQRAQKLSAEVEQLLQKLSESTNTIASLEASLQGFRATMKKYQDAAQNRDLVGSPLRVAQKGSVPLHPNRPHRLQLLALGTLGGLLAGLLLSLALGMIDSSLRSVEETERLLGLTVLAAVPRVPSRQPKPGPLGPNDQAHYAVAEAFRSLRTSISVIAKEKELKSFLFTSATPKEGKTLCALGYAVSLAQQGFRTLLIECDLRRPMAAVALSGIKQDSLGVSDYLKVQPSPSTFQPAEPKPRSESGLSFAELRRKQHTVAEAANSPAAPSRPAERSATSNVTLDEILQKTEIDSLSFVSAGTPVPNPAELLARQGLSRLLGEALRRFDRIVIDAAPLMGISDTLLLVNQVQATCLVVRAYQTPRKAVLRTVEMLRRADAPLIGAIMNDFNAAKSERYDDYYQFYGRETKPGATKTS